MSSESTGRVVPQLPLFTGSVPLLRSLYLSLVKFRILFKISLLTYKTFHEKQPLYLHSVLATSLPFHSLRSNKGITLSVPRVKTNTGTRAFHFCAPSLWNSTLLSLHSAISVATLKNMSRHMSLTWPFAHRHELVWWPPVDAKELLHRFCC